MIQAPVSATLREGGTTSSVKSSACVKAAPVHSTPPMDRDTLVNHRDFWTEELSGTRVLRDLPTLDPFEQSLYDDLRNDRLGDRVRLEQERVQYQRVEQAVL